MVLTTTVVLFCSIQCNPNFPHELLLRETTIFEEQARVAFSESTWTMLLDLDIRPIKQTITSVRNKIENYSQTWQSSSKNGDRLQKSLATRILNKIALFKDDLEQTENRLEIVLTALNTETRSRRGIIDGGGKVLKWLFGVATSNDLETINAEMNSLSQSNRKIVHIIEKQATLVNESLTESRMNAEMIASLNKKMELLGLAFQQLSSRGAQPLEYLQEIDVFIDSMTHALEWLHQRVQDLDSGFILLGAFRLPPQIFPPSRFWAALQEINKNLPRGWAVLGEEVWTVYREAKVRVATMDGQFRLFIDIAIYDHSSKFQLYKLHRLPSLMPNTSTGMLFINIPDYLAVAHDLDTYVELSTKEMEKCGDTTQICRFNTALSKRMFRKSCAIALFTQDEEKIAQECKRKLAEWRGPEALYLGANRWAMSAEKEQVIAFSCPAGGKLPLLWTKTVPVVGIFEVPLGCSARTSHWIFPTSLEGKQSVNPQPFIPPLMDTPSITRRNHQDNSVLESSFANSSVVPLISELLRRNAQMTRVSEITEQEIKEVLSETTHDSTTRGYPYEFVATTTALFIMVIVLLYMYINLRKRIRMHENFENMTSAPDPA